MAVGLLTPDARLRVFSDLGVVLPGARLYPYVAGTPSTWQNTFSDVALTIPNTLPIVASAAGLFGPIYLVPGLSYKLRLADANDVEVWVQDDVMVPGTSSVATGGTGAVTFTSHGVLIGQGTGALTATGAGTVGQVLTSNGPAADPTFQDGGVNFLQIEAFL